MIYLSPKCIVFKCVYKHGSNSILFIFKFQRLFFYGLETSSKYAIL